MTAGKKNRKKRQWNKIHSKFTKVKEFQEVKMQRVFSFFDCKRGKNKVLMNYQEKKMFEEKFGIGKKNIHIDDRII